MRAALRLAADIGVIVASLLPFALLVAFLAYTAGAT